MALSLYVSTFQVVMRANTGSEDSWSHIYGSLCCLRQALLCSACKNLLLIPHHPANSRCQHNYCRKCIRGRKPKCKWCNKNPDFEEHVRLRIVLQCYKRMCKYILTSAICRSFKRSKLNSPMLRFISMVYEGAGLRDVYHTSAGHASGFLKKRTIQDPVSNSENENTQPVNGQRPLYGVKLNEMKSPKAAMNRTRMIATTLAKDILAAYPPPEESSDDSDIDCPQILAECLRSVKKRKSCRCGMASSHPGNLTCLGQRCPCYVGGRACITCRCRGCRNPQKNLINSPPYRSNHSHYNDSDYENLDDHVESESIESDEGIIEFDKSNEEITESNESEEESIEPQESDEEINETHESSEEISESEEESIEPQESDEEIIELHDSDEEIMESHESDEEIMESHESDEEMIQGHQLEEEIESEHEVIILDDETDDSSKEMSYSESGKDPSD